MPHLPIRLAVFDIAGTTVHDERYVHKAFVSAFAVYSMPVTLEDAAGVMGLEKHNAIHSLLLKYEEYDKAEDPTWVERIYVRFQEAMQTFYRESPEVRPTANAEETFAALRKMHIKVALNTGFASAITQIIIERLGWDEVVDYWISSDEVPKGRPHPYMIQTLMEDAEIGSPLEVVKIGDTVADMEEGINAGCAFVVGVTTGNCTAEELKAAKATHVIRILSDLVPIIAGHNKSAS